MEYIKISKVEHNDLPPFIYIPVDKSFFDPVPLVGNANASAIKNIKTKYALQKLPNDYYTVFKCELSEDNKDK